MASTEYIAIVTPEAAAAAFNRFTNVSLAEESLRKAQEELAYASSSISAGSPARRRCAEKVIDAYASVTETTVFVANNSIGGRHVVASDEAVGFVPAFAMRYADDWYWWGFHTLDLAQPGWEEVVFSSATSRSSLRATPHIRGVWLECEPGYDPDYRGSYYESWQRAAGYPLLHGNDEVVYSTSSPGYAVA